MSATKHRPGSRYSHASSVNGQKHESKFEDGDCKVQNGRLEEKAAW